MGEFRNGVADADSATFVVSKNKEESTLYPDCVIGFEHAAYDSAKLDVAVTSEQQDGSMVRRGRVWGIELRATLFDSRPVTETI